MENSGDDFMKNVLKNIPIFLPRIIKEAIEIQKHPNNFNRDDSYKLSFTWKQLIENNRPA